MSGLLPQSFIDELITKAEISEQIAKRIKIKKAGNEYHALCPFHGEKTPSFTISDKKKFFYCFGCGASGNIIKFIMLFEQIDFRSAVNVLADSLGITLPATQTDVKQNNINQQTKQILTNLSDYYKKQLAKYKFANDYFQKRNISQATIAKYNLGYSPKDQPPIEKILSHMGNINNLTDQAGITYTNENQVKKTRFKNRVIFPIRNIYGDTIGFGARKLTNDHPGPKYINSPETEVFKKSFELYGLYEIKANKIDSNTLIVVEGYMDVITLSEHGIYNAVATLGTAINKNHLKTLSRYCKNIIFCFDGDNAGKKAAWKALQQALPIMDQEISIYFVILDNQEDPDSILNQHGKNAFIDKLNAKTDAVKFFIDALFANHNDANIIQKTKATKNAIEIIKTIPNGVFKQFLTQKIENLLDIKINEFMPTSATKPTSIVQPIKLKNNTYDFETLISMILQNPDIANKITIPTLIQQYDSNKVKWLIKIITTIQDSTTSISTAHLLAKWESHKAYEWLVSLSMHKHLIEKELFYNECIARLNSINIKLLQTKINAIIREAKVRELTQQEKLALRDLIAIKNQSK